MSQANTIQMVNENGLAFRGHLNEALEALATDFSGTSAPVETFPRMRWLDTSTAPPKCMLRNDANTDWENITPNTQIQFKDEGTNLGTAGTVDTINFVGDGLSATRDGNTITVTYTPPVRAWQNMFSSRSYGIVYTNTTSHPITVSIAASCTTNTDFFLIIGGQAAVQSDSQTSPGFSAAIYAEVPAGATYQLSQSGVGAVSVSRWFELR